MRTSLPFQSGFLLMFHEAHMQQSQPMSHKMMICELWRCALTSAALSALSATKVQVYLQVGTDYDCNSDT